VYGCSAMETHFMMLPTNNYWAEVASRGRLELCSECCNRGQTIFTRYALQHSAARPVASVAYHFAAEPLLLLDVSTSQ
jgi:hypothetical protein